MSEGKPGRQAKSVRHEIDARDDVQLGFPVQGQVDGRIGKFVVEADDAGRTEPGESMLKTQIGAAAVEPGEGWGSADQLMTFIETAKAEAGAKRCQCFDGVGPVDKVFKADGIVDGGWGGAETDADGHLVAGVRRVLRP